MKKKLILSYFKNITNGELVTVKSCSDIFFIYLFITHYLLPPPQGLHASCHEMSYSKKRNKA